MDRYIEHKYSLSKTNKTIFLSLRTARMLRAHGTDFEEFLDICIRDYLKMLTDIESGESEYDGIGSYEGQYKEAEFSLHNYKNEIYVIENDLSEGIELSNYINELSDTDMLDDDQIYSDLLNKAEMIATRAHRDQTDKAGKPYIEHPKYVSDMVEGRAEKIVALLHDVVEDTNMTVDDIGEMFPDVITKAVDAMTRRKDEFYTNYIVRLRTNTVARNVKIEDMKHNMDISRISDPTDADLKRVERYSQYLKILETDYYYEDLALEVGDPELRMIDYQIDGYDFHRAVRLIKDADKDRIRKAIEVNNILRDFGATIDVQIAAIMYCCIEPDVTSVLGIANNFGEKVFDTYLRMPWNYDVPIEDRTEMVEAFLPKANDAQKQIMLAIAIAELREYEYLAYKYGQSGVFANKDEKLRYEEYFSVLTAGFDEYEDDEKMSQYYWTLQNLFKDVFTSYHVNKEHTELYQGCDLYCWVWKHHDDKEDEVWTECPVREFPEDEFELLTREAAETLENSWTGKLPF